MPFITENRLRTVFDLPIALPATIVKQGDWVVAATVRILAPQRLSLRSLTLELLEATVDTTLIVPTNKIVPSLGLAYCVLRKDYVSGTPGQTGALDSLKVEGLTTASRSTVPVLVTAPGNYSLIVANNMQPSTSSPISTATGIDFKLVVTGQFRQELNAL